ncbi:MAG: YncE family protein [Bacteroidetes bacterium]|nr:YncE family protein [Bacteroidota bacterium]
MRRTAHIGFSLAEKLKAFFSEKKKSESPMVEKTYEGTDDQFFEATNSNLRTILKLDDQPEQIEKTERYKKDLKRYGTRSKVIDVADDAIQKKRIKEILPLKEPAKNASEKFDTPYEKDLKRYGTMQRVIDVANDDPKRKKKLNTLPKDFSKAAYQDSLNRYKLRDTTSYSANPFSDIYRDFPKLQITLSNNSTEEKDIQLWGASKHLSINPPLPQDVQDHTVSASITIPGGVYPQGIAVNPANQCIYIADQLSGTVTVIDSNNQFAALIQLEPTFPGFTSPVALAVNTTPTSEKYGYVYVACSVSNTIAVIDLSFHVAAYINTGKRPLAVAYNPVNHFIYVANLVSDTVSVFDAETFAEVALSPLATGNDPIGVGVNPINGEVYVANSLGNSLTVYSSDNTLLTTIAGIGQYPVSVTYNPSNNCMYAVAANSNRVYQIEAGSHTILSSLATGNKPYNSFFNSYNNYLYVQNRGDNTFTIILPDNSQIDGLSFGGQNIGGAFNSFNNFIYVSDTANNSINAIGYLEESSLLSFSPDYAEIREDLKNSPAIVEHVKFVVTGQERLNSFRLNKFTPTGRVHSVPISFEQFASPQNTLNVAEVTALAGTIIDGKMNWFFKLPGLHTVSILVWFRQFETRSILPFSNYQSTNKTQKS